LNISDTFVEPISQVEFEKEVFGGSRTGAYLLFYVQVGAQVAGIPILGEFDVPWPQTTLNEINRDNDRFRIEGSAYSEPLANLVLRQARWAEFSDYYFNIFCRSQLTHLADKFVERFEKTDAIQLVQWMRANFETKVLPVFMNCSVPAMVSSLVSVITTLIPKIGPEESADFLTLFVHHLPVFVGAWRQVPVVGRLLLDFLAQGPFQIALAQSQVWTATIAEYIGQVYGEERGDILLTTIDLSCLLDCLIYLAIPDDSALLQVIPTLFPCLSKSKAQQQSLKHFLVRGVEQSLYDVADIAKLIPSEFNRRRSWRERLHVSLRRPFGP
jgi:hypothetical protein